MIRPSQGPTCDFQYWAPCDQNLNFAPDLINREEFLSSLSASHIHAPIDCVGTVNTPLPPLWMVLCNKLRKCLWQCVVLSASWSKLNIVKLFSPHTKIFLLFLKAHIGTWVFWFPRRYFHDQNQVHLTFLPTWLLIVLKCIFKSLTSLISWLVCWTPKVQWRTTPLNNEFFRKCCFQQWSNWTFWVLWICHLFHFIVLLSLLCRDHFSLLKVFFAISA